VGAGSEEEQVAEIITIRDAGLGNTSYLVDLGDGRGLMLDPSRDPGPYVAVAERRGVRLDWTVETHLHADFVSGSRELAAVGATVVAPAAAQLAFPYHRMDDGEELDLGGLSLRALGTPGHTPEHLAWLLVAGGRPLALFSGGSLLVGAVARTDLISPERTEELARALWRSLHERILTLPDDLPVYPTHGAGSFCSAPTGAEQTTTIGREKATNPLLAAPDEDAFVKLLLGGLGSYPPYFLRLRETNRRGPRLYGATPPPLTPLSPEQVRRLLGQGAELVDARPIESFAAGHIPGALSIPLRDAFATWLGWLMPDDRPLVVVLDADQDRDELVRQCLKVGYERLDGELAGGMAAWRSAGLPEARIELAGVADKANGTVLDVRQQAEFTSGHLPGAHHVELGALAGDELPPGPMEVMCGHGERAMTGASLLQRAGRGDLTVLVGGPDDWSEATGRPLEAS
jgi:hydroxyacylglutathione hydrolase